MKIHGLQKTILWYDQNADQYAKDTAETSTPEEIDQFIEHLPKEAQVLDAGCGGGRDTNLLSKKGLKVVGLDISSSLIKIAQNTYPECAFIQGDMLALPFADEHFDGVWSHASLVHLETDKEIGQTLQEFHRVMKKSAILHVLVRGQSGTEKNTVTANTLSKDGRFFRYFTKNELRTALKKAGFEILSLDQYQETDKNPKRRPDVSWILSLCRKPF